MYRTLRFLSLLITLSCSLHFAEAQEIKFDKKSGEFSNASGVIAKLEDEKARSEGGKNFYIKDATGQNELLAYSIHRFEDTFAHPSIYYYTITCKPLGLTAYRTNFTGMLNTFREVGEHVVSNNLLLPDGKINEPAMRAYFAAATSTMGDYPARLKAVQDSLVALVSIDAPPVERDRRKPFTANEYGKIGQGNVVIGTWELIETKGEGLNNSTYHFRIKNLAGGIVCISWIALSGSHTYAFKGGARSKENWTVQDLVNNNPLDHKEQYVVQLATALSRMGLL